MKRIIVLSLIIGALTGCPNNSSSGSPAPHEGDGHDHGAEKAHTEGQGPQHREGRRLSARPRGGGAACGA